MTAAPDAPATLLLYAPVPVYRKGNDVWLEDQACNGLRLWASHFERLILVIPQNPGEPPPAYVPMRDALGPDLDRIEIVTVPPGYRPDRFLRALPGTSKKLKDAIGRADYIGWAIGGLFGDWGAVGAILTHRAGKPFYVWADRVESEVTRRASQSGRFRTRLRAKLTHRPMAWLERYVVRRAALGLFHGQETFDAYAPYCANSHVVHDIHIRKEDHIPEDRLTQKIAAATEGPLRLVYVGRADPMKGPDDWLSVVETAVTQGADIQATWLGEGSELGAMRERVNAGPLKGRVELPGFLRDRAAILEALRDAHAMLFCHKTPESPRCLIEALTSGTPIVGYDSAFPRELIALHGGGRLTPRDDVAALAKVVVDLATDRNQLAVLIDRAARDGAQFDDETVFRHRSELIRQNLPRAR